ncbi:MAG: SDR family NAD(P)-dependent oxidoreductase [Hyphomicrobiales bacterium]|nr:SDR family NAD(P)-dependent oxidoreductase [Hyphomicrobiales bacterium]
MTEQHTKQTTPIAVVGIGAMFPGRGTTVGYWRDVLEGRDTTSEVPETHWRVADHYDEDPSRPDKTYSRRGAFIPDFAFDPVEFGTPPTVIETTDTVQLMALYVAKQVLAEATRTGFSEIDRERTSVILGVAAGTELIGDMASRLNRPIWLKAMAEAGIADDEANRIADNIASHYTDWRESTFPGLLGNVVAGRIANRLDLKGTNFTADAACASSLAALKHAMQELSLGESDLVLTGGADALNAIFMYMCFSKTPAMSPSGACRPFSSDADGTLMGEGCGILALRRLEDAERDGNPIYAVIRGVGTSSDGSGTSVYAPRSGGQALALGRAYEMAGYSPRTVGLVEAHGTGTRAGDAAEFGGLCEVFGADAAGSEHWCALGSVKSQIGHTKSASGAAGLIKVILALHHKVLPPTINVAEPNPRLAIDGSPFYLNTTARPWVRAANDPPRRASVSSFGFGGSNFHVAVEEYAGAAAIPSKYRTSPAELFVFSAASADGLRAAIEERLSAPISDADLAHHAKESAGSFNNESPFRLAAVANSADDLRVKIQTGLVSLTRGEPLAAPDIMLEIGTGEAGDVAFLFSGQGSQYVNMGADLAMTYDCAREAWERADAVLRLDSKRLSDVVFAPTSFDEETRADQERTLTATENAQPAIAAVALSQLAVLDKLAIKPAVVAGHSFGEIIALHAAGVFGAEAAIALARDRGAAMAAAAGGSDSGMLVVLAGIDAVEAALRSTDGDVVIANDNGPGQVVLSGTKSALDSVAQQLEAMGLRTSHLPVATGFHSPIVASAAEDMSAALEETCLAPPSIPVFANATAQAYPSDVAHIKAIASDQLTKPVRFREMIDAMYAQGVRVFVEVGPKSVLKTLVGQILDAKHHVAVAIDDSSIDDTHALLRAVGRLAVAGVAMDLNYLWAEAPGPAPTPVPPKHAIWLNGANYKKPYPPRSAEVRRPLTSDSDPTSTDVAPVAPPTAPSANGPLVKEAKPSPVLNQPVGAPEAAASRSPTAGAWVPAPARPAAVPMAAVAGVGDTVRSVVAEKTGYPPEMLDLDMDLEAELGIDSIKQVEILSALRERLPSMPEIDPSRLAELRTLSQIASALSGGAPASGAVLSVPARPEPSQVQAASAPTAARADVSDTVRSVVAEKTGYPPEMLDLDMDLEAELGIDSIKQVEILSALREHLPSMPEIDPSRLAELRTLSQIAGALGGSASASEPMSPVAVVPQPEPTPVKASAVPMTAVAEIGDTVRSVVAEKTGYPPEMLDLDMDLEAELGIDSIKQVEILSALRERLPSMPEIDPSRLAELRTLAQIAEALSGGAPLSSVSIPDPETAVVVNVDAYRADKTAERAFKLGLSRQRVELKESPASGHTPDCFKPGRRVAITDCAPEIAELLADELDARGLKASLVDSGAVGEVDAVVVTSGLSSTLSGYEVHLSGLHAARSVAPRFAEGGGGFVTLQDTGGDLGRTSHDTSSALAGGLTGLVKTARHEWPLAEVKAIDVERDRHPVSGSLDPRTTCRRIVDEVLLGGRDVEVGLPNDGRRLVPHCVIDADQDRAVRESIEEGSVVVVSGGGRGITAKAIVELAKGVRLRFALFGRSELVEAPAYCPATASESEIRGLLARAELAAGRSPSPKEIARQASRIAASREIRATLEALRNAGSEAEYHVVDITDVMAVIHRCAIVQREWGPIRGLVHGAGVIADKLIKDKTDNRFGPVFATKVTGLQALLAACGSNALQFIALFSSISGRFGSAGQCDYAMANEVLNRAAWALRNSRPECRVVAINWGPWDGGMVTDAIRTYFEDNQIPIIPSDIGAAAFARELLTAGDGHPEIVFAGPVDSLPGQHVAII